MMIKENSQEQFFTESFVNRIKYIHEVKIFNEIQNNKKILIFDLRKREEFTSCNLDLSVNIPFDEYNYEFFALNSNTKFEEVNKKENPSKELKDRLKHFKRYYIVIIISNEKIKRKTIENCESDDIDSESKERIIKTLILYRYFITNGVREIGLYNLGMENMKDKYEYLMNIHKEKPLVKDIASFPTDILDHRIYVGNQRHATSEEVIKFLKITHIINITQHVENNFEKQGVKYLNIQIEDTPAFRISKYFKTAFDFIEEALTINSATSCQISTADSTDNLQTHELNAENVDSELTQFIVDLIDIKVIDETISKQQQFAVNAFENWREVFESTNDLYMKNKIIQLGFKNLFHKSKSNTRILIHCSMGVSRSPTIAIMYLMKKFLLSLDDAYALMQLHREKSAPINSFLDELRDLENNGFKFTDEEYESKLIS